MNQPPYPILPVHELPTGKKTGYLCQSGRHEWDRREDAQKCCHPDWVQGQRIIKSLTGFGITYLGPHWIKVNP